MVPDRNTLFFGPYARLSSASPSASTKRYPIFHACHPPSSALASAIQSSNALSLLDTSVSPYAAQSGQIFGILTQMMEQMDKDLASAQQDEAAAVKEFQAMRKAKRDQIAATRTELGKTKDVLARTQEQLARAKKSVKETKDQLEADRKFLADLEVRCKADKDVGLFVMFVGGST